MSSALVGPDGVMTAGAHEVVQSHGNKGQTLGGETGNFRQSGTAFTLALVKQEGIWPPHPSWLVDSRVRCIRCRLHLTVGARRKIRDSDHNS